MEQIGEYEEQFRDAYSDAVALVKVCLTVAGVRIQQALVPVSQTHSFQHLPVKAAR